MSAPAKKPAALPFFGDAYLADTTHLTTEEHGAYFLLLLAAWRQPDCALPDDDRKLARIAGLTPRKWKAIKPTIMDFWTAENGRIFQSRQRRERAWVDQKSEHNRQAAEARWNGQPAENKQGGGKRSQSKRNAPPPPPHKTREAKASLVSREAPLPADFVPVLTPAAQRVVDGWPPGLFEKQLERFRDHAATHGRLAKDWQAAFRTWINNHEDRRQADAPRNSPHHHEQSEFTNPYVIGAREREAEREAERAAARG